MISFNNLSRIKNIKSLITPWFVVLSGSLFFFYSQLQLNIYNSINTSIMSYFQINATTSSHLASITLFATLNYIIFAGILIYRFSIQKIMISTIFLSSFGNMLLSMSESLTSAFIGRYIIGIGSAFCFLSCIRLASEWFPEKRMAVVTSVIVSISMLGGMAAQRPVIILSNLYGWRNTLILDSILGLFLMTWIKLFVRNNLTNKSNQTNLSLAMKEMFISFKNAYSNYRNWICGLYTSFINLPIWLLGASWGNPFLTQTYYLDAKNSSNTTSMLYLGVMIGGPIFGWVSDYIRKRKILMYVGSIMSIIILCAILYLKNVDLLKLQLLFFFEGFFIASQIISYAMVSEINAKSETAISVSVISFATIGLGALFQIIFGTLMDLISKPQIINYVPVYSRHAYIISLSMLPILAAISTLLVTFMTETCSKTYTNK